MDDAQLQTVWQQRQLPPAATPLSAPLTILMKHKLGKRVKGLSGLSDAWQEVVPAEFLEHTSLEAFNRGTLTVAVDSASHRFQIKNLLAAGLQAELQKRFSGTLNRVRLIPGRFATTDATGAARYVL